MSSNGENVNSRHPTYTTPGFVVQFGVGLVVTWQTLSVAGVTLESDEVVFILFLSSEDSSFGSSSYEVPLITGSTITTNNSCTSFLAF